MSYYFSPVYCVTTGQLKSYLPSTKYVQYLIALVGIFHSAITWTLSPVPPPMPMQIAGRESTRDDGVLKSRELACFSFAGSATDTTWFLEWEESSFVEGNSVSL